MSNKTVIRQLKAILEKWVPYSQRYLFNAIPDTNHNANPTNPNTKYRCEYGTRFSRIATIKYHYPILFNVFIQRLNNEPFIKQICYHIQ